MVNPVVFWHFWSRRLSLPVKDGICPLPLVRRMVLHGVLVLLLPCCLVPHCCPPRYLNLNFSLSLSLSLSHFSFPYRPSPGHCSSFFIKHQQKKSVSSCGLLLFMCVRHRVAFGGWPRGCWSFHDLFRCLLGADGLY